MDWDTIYPRLQTQDILGKLSFHRGAFDLLGRQTELSISALKHTSLTGFLKAFIHSQAFLCIMKVCISEHSVDALCRDGTSEISHLQNTLTTTFRLISSCT